MNVNSTFDLNVKNKETVRKLARMIYERLKEGVIWFKIDLSDYDTVYTVLVMDCKKLMINVSGTKKFYVTIHEDILDKGFIRIGNHPPARFADILEVLDAILGLLETPLHEINQAPSGFVLTNNDVPLEQSLKHYKSAIDLRYFHEEFVLFCLRYGLKCLLI